MEKLEDRGIIRPPTSTWAPDVCVTARKKDGTVLRVCQNYRALNALKKTDIGGLGDVQNIFDRLRMSEKYYSALDFRVFPNRHR